MPTRRQVLLSAGALLGSNGRVLAAASGNMLQLRVEYSATSVIGTDALAAPGRLWRTRSALRYEGTQHGRALTAIARLDRNLGWLVMAAPRLAIETDLSALDLPLDVLTGSGSLGQVREARERVNGLDTTRIRVERSHGTGIRFKGHVWATDQGVIARLAGEGESHGRRGRTLINFRDVQIGPLDPGLFEAPRGVQMVHVKGADVASLLESLEAAGQFAPRR